MSNPRGSTVVDILGKEYRISCAPDEEDALRKSARLVNERMLDIRKSGKVIGTDRIAVMAALNLAHELLDQAPGEAVDLTSAQQHLRCLHEQVEAALDDHAQMEI